MEARKRALAKKKKLRTLGRRARSRDSDEDQEEEDGEYSWARRGERLTFFHFVRSSFLNDPFRYNFQSFKNKFI